MERVNVRFTAIVSPARKPFPLKGEISNPFSAGGRWLKGETHFHPGGWEEEAVELYSRLGFDFIVRGRGGRLPGGEELLTVPGCEIKFCAAGGFLAHLVAVGAEEEFKAGSGRESPVCLLENVIGELSRRGALSFLAHPIYSGWSFFDMERLCRAGLHGIEVLNGACLQDKGDCGRADQVWLQLMRGGHTLSAAGAGDAKKGSRRRANRAWTGVLSADRSVNGVMEAMRLGRTYASEGPSFRGVYIDGAGRLRVDCSPCAACHLLPVRGGFKSVSAFPPGRSRVSGSFIFELSGLTWQQDAVGGAGRPGEGLLLVLQAPDGGKAWLSPIGIRIGRAGQGRGTCP